MIAEKTTVALMISTHNWPLALHRVLSSVRMQSVLPNEILIADDGSDVSTKEIVDLFKSRLSVPIKHFWQPNNGFQKASILNKAIAGTRCDYIVQTDGDIVLHKHFIKDHIKAAEPGHFIRGSRVLLSETKTKRILTGQALNRISPFAKGIINRINAIRIPFFNSFFSSYSKRSHNMHGCNCSYWRTDFVRVNGYNNSFVGWGHEDIELAARFVNAGLTQKKIKMRAVCYHLHHPLAERSSVAHNYKAYEESVRSRIKRCLNGYNQQQYAYQD